MLGTWQPLCTQRQALHLGINHLIAHPSMVMSTCPPPKVEAGGSGVQDHPRLHTEFEILSQNKKLQLKEQLDHKIGLGMQRLRYKPPTPHSACPTRRALPQHGSKALLFCTWGN